VRPAGSVDYVRDCVEEVLRTGFLLIVLDDNLVDNLPENAFPGERNAEVMLEMLIGTIRAAVGGCEKSVRSAVALFAACKTRTLTDRERNAGLARRREYGARRRRRDRRH
jgi:hypothetical protein